MTYVLYYNLTACQDEKGLSTTLSIPTFVRMLTELSILYSDNYILYTLSRDPSTLFML
jgi:hypothetical protein